MDGWSRSSKDSGRDLRSRGSIARWDVRRYDNGLVIDAYVDIGTVDGNTMAWLLEIVWDAPRWIVKSRVTTNRAEYEEVLTRYPDRGATSLEQLIAELETATDILIEAAESPKWVG